MLYFKHQFVSVDRTLELYFVGCSKKCPGCQNYDLQAPSGIAKHVSPIDIINSILDYRKIAKQVHILGGEPLEQPENELKTLLCCMCSLGFKNIVLFTGWNIALELITKKHPIFGLVDFVKTGMYDENNLNVNKVKEPLLGLELASLNQKLYKVE